MYESRIQCRKNTRRNLRQHFCLHGSRSPFSPETLMFCYVCYINIKTRCVLKLPWSSERTSPRERFSHEAVSAEIRKHTQKQLEASKPLLKATEPMLNYCSAQNPDNCRNANINKPCPKIFRNKKLLLEVVHSETFLTRFPPAAVLSLFSRRV